MRHEYNMMMLREQEIRNEAQAQGMAQGMAQGIELDELEKTRAIMEALNMNARQAMSLLRIPEERQRKYMDRLNTEPS